MNKIDITRADFYLCDKPELRERTQNRLRQISAMGLEEASVASFGIPNVMSGLYIELVWSFSDERWNDYINWIKELVQSKIKARNEAIEILEKYNAHLLKEGYADSDLYTVSITAIDSFLATKWAKEKFPIIRK